MHRLFLLAAPVLAAVLYLAPNSPAAAAVVINVDKSTQRMTVSVDGQHRWTWPVSTGRAGYATPSGRFTAFRMEEDHYSKEWDEAPMPHSIFFTSEGHAIHGSLETKNLGRRASHGCVRLAPENAARLFELVREQGVSNAKVVVHGGDGAPLVAKRKAPRESEEAMMALPPGGYAPPSPEASGPPAGYAPYGYAPYRYGGPSGYGAQGYAPAPPAYYRRDIY